MVSASVPWSTQISFDNPMAAMLQISMSEETPQVPSHLSSELHDFLNCCLQLVPERRASIRSLSSHVFLQ